MNFYLKHEKPSITSLWSDASQSTKLSADKSIKQMNMVANKKNQHMN